MKNKVVVLDFDGTVTDAEKEAIPFRKAWETDLAALSGIPLAEVTFLMQNFEDEILRNPTSYAWEMNGHSVAPGSVDPYIRTRVAAGLLLDSRQMFLDAKERGAWFEKFWKDNYKKSDIVFRPGAREFLNSVHKCAPSYIVTNSDTDPVQKKLATLDSDFPTERVRGTAKKFLIDRVPGFPGAMSIPGLSRPVILKRRLYLGSLCEILQEHHCKWRGMTVVGDIFELDLAVPMHLGCRVGLLANEFTPLYEVEFLEKQPNARVLWDLTQALAFIQE